MCYLDDILINSTNQKEDEDHVQNVPKRLPEFVLYCKAEKCPFGVSEGGFLGFIINCDCISNELDHLSKIEDWPTSKSVQDLQVLLGLANFD